MYHNGYDFFIGPDDDMSSHICKVCDTTCDKDAIYGPTGFISSIKGDKEYHTRHICRYAEYEWHQQAYELLIFMQACPSKTLKSIMLTDLEVLLKNKHE